MLSDDADRLPLQSMGDLCLKSHVSCWNTDTRMRLRQHQDTAIQHWDSRTVSNFLYLAEFVPNACPDEHPSRNGYGVIIGMDRLTIRCSAGHDC